MSDQPGQAWQNNPSWDPNQQPQAAQPWQQQPQPVSYNYGAPPKPVMGPSIWRLAVGIWLGFMLIFLTFILLAAIFGNSIESDFNDNSPFSLGTTSGVLPS